MKEPTAQQAIRMRRLRSQVMADPLWKRVQGKAQSLLANGSLSPMGDQPPLTVIDALGEQLSLGASCLDPDWTRGQWADDVDECEERLKLAGHVLNAHPFYWKQELIKEATSSMVIPDHIVGNTLLPYPAMYVTADKSLFNDPSRDLQIEAMLWLESGPGLDIVSFIADMDGGGRCYLLDYIRIPHGAKFPEECPLNSRQILSMVAFLNSPYVSITRHRADRAARRERLRLEQPMPEPELAVIQLRAREKRPDATYFDAAGAHPGDSGHWWVRGHIRAQWYATEQSHKLIWIAPHIRGNPEAPLKHQAYGVVR